MTKTVMLHLEKVQKIQEIKSLIRDDVAIEVHFKLKILYEIILQQALIPIGIIRVIRHMKKFPIMF